MKQKKYCELAVGDKFILTLSDKDNVFMKTDYFFADTKETIINTKRRSTIAVQLSSGRTVAVFENAPVWVFEESYPELAKIMSIDKLSNFHFLDEPRHFSEYFRDTNYFVEVICCYEFNEKMQCVFSGTFRWDNNEIISSEDKDSYNKDMIIYGFQTFIHMDDNGQFPGLRIVVMDF